jgi:adenosine deaminase
MDIAKFPKAELHLHFEGGIPRKALLALMERHRIGDPLENSSRIAQKSYRNYAEFVETWRFRRSCLRSQEDVEYAAGEVARCLLEDGVRYAEVHVSPTGFGRQGLRLDTLAMALRSGFDRAAPAALVVKLIVDVVRDHGPENAMRLVCKAADVAEPAGIVAVGLGGDESRFPAEAFEAVFRRAADLGLHRVAHAGETAGASSIWSAVCRLGAERVGHGTRADEDPALIEFLRARGVPIEVCLTSNLRLGVVADLTRHPLRTFLDAGLRTVLSTDDPSMFGTNLIKEYETARHVLGLDDRTLRRLMRNGFEAAFLSPTERSAFLRECDRAEAATTGAGPVPLPCLLSRKAVSGEMPRYVTTDRLRELIGLLVVVKLDRPLGSAHPKYGWHYPINYGYAPGLLAPDGDWVDAYILGVDTPLDWFQGRCIALIHRLNDDDDKLIVVPDGLSVLDEEIRRATAFQERFFRSEIIRQL